MEPQVKSWSNGQAYGLAAICLLLGIGAGYLFHTPSQAAVGQPRARQEAPRGAVGSTNLTLEQMKESWHTQDEKKPPRLVSFLFKKPG